MEKISNKTNKAIFESNAQACDIMNDIIKKDMEKKINIVELLKDCPKGTKLYSPLCGECYLDIIDCRYIKVDTPTNEGFCFNHNGTYCLLGETMLFPSKENRDWSTFQRPFKDGDIVITKTSNNFLFYSIYQGIENRKVLTYVDYTRDDNRLINIGEALCYTWEIIEQRFATEEEKKKLFQAIKDNGYKWNTETKIFEKLPKFKVGYKIKKSGDTRLVTIQDVRDNYYIITIPDYFGHCCITDKLPFSKQEEYELVTDKFNINALKPFDKVLVRGNVGQKWIIDFFGFMDNDKGLPFVCVGHYVIQCIPYEGNEHLLDTNNDCDDFYKIWE